MAGTVSPVGEEQQGSRWGLGLFDHVASSISGAAPAAESEQNAAAAEGSNDPEIELVSPPNDASSDQPGSQSEQADDPSAEERLTEEDEERRRKRKPIRSSSMSTQMQLMLWKHYVTKTRDSKQVVAGWGVPFMLFLSMWLLGKEPYEFDGDADHVFAPIAFIVLPITQVVGLVAEKELGLKELMTQSGLQPLVFTASWFIAEAVNSAIISFALSVFCLITGIMQVFGIVSMLQLFFFLWVYLVASAAFCFFLGAIFNRSSVAAMAVFVIYAGFIAIVLVSGLQRDYENVGPHCTDTYEATADDTYWQIDGYLNVTADCPSTMELPPANCTQLMSCYDQYDDVVCPGLKQICRESCGECYDKYKGFTDGQQAMLCLIPTFALTLGIYGRNPSYDQALPIGEIMGLMLVSTLLYAFVGWYISQVMPGELGVPKPWYFVFDPHVWASLGLEFFTSCTQTLFCCCITAGGRFCCENPACLRCHVDELDAEVNPSLPTVIVEGLRREFGKHVAVDRLNFEMLEGEIFALLGHNGAGKTTTISMLTGLLQPTAGDAVVYGNRMSDNMAGVRRLLGVCPQHDVLFDYLTVGEHIEFFALLKGASEEEMDRERTAMLNAFELSERCDYFPFGLSGGMKRKVCVAIALTGDTRLVVLDEPTTGLDPGARRRLWHTLSLLKRGRSVLLTTHYMDEAEVLGDRVGIMKDGKLACCGPPNQLKHDFQCGYELLVTAYGDAFDPGASDSVCGMIRKLVPGSRQDHAHVVANELKFQLPLDARPQFADFFDKLDFEKDLLGVKGYGISMAPLEEVFLKVGRETRLGQHALKRQQSTSHNKLLVTSLAEEGEGNEALDEEAPMGECSLSEGSPVPSPRPVDPMDRTAGAGGEYDIKTYSEFGVGLTYQPDFWEQARAIFIRRMLIAKNGLAIDFAQAQILINDIKKRGCRMDDLKRVPGLYRGVQTFMLLGMPIGAAVAALVLRSTTDDLDVMNIDIDDQIDDDQTLAIADITPDIVAACILVAGYIMMPGFIAEVLVSERACKLRNLLTVMGCDHRAFWLGHFAADFLMWLIPAFVTFCLLWSYDLPSWTHDGLSFVVVMLFGLELHAYCYALSYGFQSAAAAVAVIPVVTIGMMVVPIVIVLIAVFLDSQISSSEDQLEMQEITACLLGLLALCSPHGFLLASLIQITFPRHLSESEIVLSGKYSPVWLFCLTSMIKTLAFGAATFWVDSKDTLPLPASDHFDTPAAELANLDSDVLDEYKCVNGPPSEPADKCTCESPAITEAQAEQGLGEGLGGGGPGEPVLDAQMMETGGGGGGGGEPALWDESKAVALQHLRKVYPKAGRGKGVHVAVKDTNLRVRRGECLGLLGPNGAGKSTTVSMLTRHSEPTRGDGWIMDHSIRTNFPLAARHMGVVTQDNTLYPELSTLNHLYLFARIRGVPESDILRLVNDAVYVMELGPHSIKPSRRLSGGMKRKLCTAVSLIGNPAIVMMDEPSAGLDPVSRRNLWKVISESMGNRSVILTTHSLDEAEALCARIGIMTKGVLRCLGSAQHLREKFGNGFEVALTLKANMSIKRRDRVFAKVDEFIAELYSNQAEVVNRHSRVITYTVPAASMHVATSFRAFEENLEALSIDTYVISQPTLEQVFLQFADAIDESSTKTTDAEADFDKAFDDTDIRLAKKSVKKCCGLERKGHVKMVKCCCPTVIVAVMLVIFGWPTLVRLLDSVFGGGERQTFPDREISGTPVCPSTAGAWPNTSDTLNYDFDWGSGYTTLNATKIIKWETSTGDYCPSHTISFTVSPNYTINSARFQVGISGDVDGYGWDGISKRPVGWDGADDTTTHMTDERVRFYYKDNNNDWKPSSSCGASSWLDWSGGSIDPVYNYQFIDGFCQAECETPFLESCKRDYASYSSNNDQDYLFPVYNIDNQTLELRVELSDGVNVRACETGMQVGIFMVLQVQCYDDYTSIFECGPRPYIVNDSVTDVYADVTDCVYDDGEYYLTRQYILIMASVMLLCFCCTSCIACNTAWIGMCCTRQPDDENGSDFRSAKKGGGVCC